ncbi:MAG: 6-phosphofructokinase [Coxiella sp. (in: Bacteria)]|nr:MAG: 6-phosphofructokinase [Coxiella sp. (in: g-proteobacteria)]
MAVKNVFYAQSGGPTSVINATACGVIQAAQKNAGIGTVYAGLNGILGALNEDLIDTSLESADAIDGLKYTPASAFGSCRYKLKSIKEDETQYRRLIDVFKAHNIGYFFYNGGGDSQDTAYKVSQISKTLDYPLTCIGLPKTIDNDLAFTDNCPGFGSVAKYIATSIKEASLDVASMCGTSTKIFVMEVMGRHAGWIAASAGLAQEFDGDAPHIILFPEIAFDKVAFLKKVKQAVTQHGYCVIAVSEGTRDKDGNFLQDSGASDAFGHKQLGGIAPVICEMIKEEHGYKYHWAVSDYLQRAARHIASQTDLDQAYKLGEKAIEFALAGENNIMLTIERLNTADYQWQVGTAPLEKVANVEHTMPRDFITKDGFGITQKCRDYMQPLLEGEAYPPYKNGIPAYTRLKKQLIEKKLKSAFSAR